MSSYGSGGGPAVYKRGRRCSILADGPMGQDVVFRDTPQQRVGLKTTCLKQLNQQLKFKKLTK